MSVIWMELIALAPEEENISELYEQQQKLSKMKYSEEKEEENEQSIQAL